METLDTLTTKACRRIRRGDRQGAHRVILKIAHAVRASSPEQLPALVLQLQSGLSLIAKAFREGAFDAPPIRGDELVDALEEGATVESLADEFEIQVHALFDASYERRFTLPTAQRAKEL